MKPLIHIPPELFNPAETAHYEGSFDFPLMKAGPDVYTFSEPVLWEVEVSNTGDALLVQGQAEVTGVTACARCGEPATIDLFGEIDGYYLLSEEDASSEDMEEDEIEILPPSHDIDMTDMIHAALLMDVPLNPMCKDDCKGICLKCGINLNEETCTCEEDYIDPLSPFAALKDLNLD